jgi:MoxR-like ATPase
MVDDEKTGVPAEDGALVYEPIFDPETPRGGASNLLAKVSPYGTHKEPLPYIYHMPEIALAVNVALATNRPLLLSGRPGSGKSTLARHVAACLGWEYQEDTVTSRTQANDLLWKFDALRRLSDASTPNIEVGEEAEYVEPGVLWWTFDPGSAWRSSSLVATKKALAGLSKITGVVVLLDEIDKAEPDVPNDLLVPLSDRKFHPKGYSEPVEAKSDYLLCITTNAERELPQAFVRRCVTLSLTRPNKDKLREIAVEHNSGLKKEDKVLDHVLTAFLELEKEMIAEHRRPPSTAEFLDAVRACLTLTPADCEKLAQFTMRKVVEVKDSEE